MKNKSVSFVVMCFLLIIVASLIIFIVYRNNRISFYLVGDDEINITYGSIFNDPGFVAKTGKGEDLSNNVSVYGDVNTIQTGGYTITYELDYNDEKKYLTRVVFVKDIDISNLEIVLNGEEDYYLLKDDTYSELGASLFNKISNTKIGNVEVLINGDVDTSLAGEYEVKYSFMYHGNSVSKIRRVHVLDVPHQLNPEGLTSDNVEITIDFSAIKNYQSVKLPDNRVLTSKSIQYNVNKNGTYKFIITTTDNKEYNKIVMIDSIVGSYICSGEITTKGTKLTVSPVSNEIMDYEWNLDGKTVKGSSTYEQSKSVKSASVTLNFMNNKKYKVDCNVTDKLVYHFKYDENNTKPFMTCQTYTDADRIALDAKLRQVVNEAGYGTRAGVVAAARFLVGGLDYKVPYVGASRYSQSGLNIGQKNAWGCSSIGLDCYYFIDWARSQNGLTLTANYAGDKFNTHDDASRIKVGDYLLTPCTSSTCKNIYNINHIALVIGIDDNYIYIAEAVTGNVNAVVAHKLDKNNLPKSGNLSLVRHVDYPSEGNVTNMWTE